MNSAIFEQLPTDYLEFTNATAEELGYGPEAVGSRFLEYTAENGQRVGVYETQSRKNNPSEHTYPTILMPASHDYRIEPLWMARADIIASRTNARVVLVDMPGTTGLLKPTENGTWEVHTSLEPLAGAKQTRKQLAHAVAGDYSLHAAIQLEAVVNTVGLDDKDEIILLGESMGAAVSADLLDVAQERGLTVREIILYEAVNFFRGYRPNVPVRLASVLPSIENDRRNQYFEENEEIGHPLKAFELVSEHQKTLDDARKSMGQQAIAAAINGLGLSRGMGGRLLNLAEEIPGRNRPDVVLVRGADSMATKPKHYEEVYDALREAGLSLRLFDVVDAHGEVPMGHSHTVSLGRQAQITDRLFERISQGYML